MAPKKKPAPVQKPMTLAEVEQKYADLAAQVGHKAMLISNTQELVVKTQAEMDKDLSWMNVLIRQRQVMQAAEAPAPEVKS